MSEQFLTSPGWGEFDKSSHPGKRKKRRRRIMRSFKMDEISAVDNPAQEDATMSIMKRAPDEELMEKVLLLTSLNESHQHVLSIDVHSLEHGGGHTDWASGQASQTSQGSPEHQHSFLINADGTITISATNAHTHEVEMGEFMGRLRLQTALATVEREDADVVIIANSVTKTEDGQKFVASDYALVLDVSQPSTWKYPLVKSSGGEVNPRRVGSAVKAIESGRIPRKEVDNVVRRVRSAWKRCHKDHSAMPSTLRRVASH